MFITDLLLDILHDKVFRFFYTIYDYFLPQKKFFCFAMGGKNQSSHNTNFLGYLNLVPFKEICRLLNRSNDIVPNPDDLMNEYLNQIEYRNFFFQDWSLEYMSKQYLYPYYVRGSEGMIIGISCNKDEDIEKTLTTTYQVSLSDLVRNAKGDDSKSLPSNYYTNPFYSVTEKKKDFRPIMFFIHSTEKKETVERIKEMVKDVIEEVGYEKHNTMVVTHLEEESNLYEGMEWLFQKRSD